MIKGTSDFETYSGHFVPVIGFDDECVYIHNPMQPPSSSPSSSSSHDHHGDCDRLYVGECQAIPKELFDVARQSIGTDSDVLFLEAPLDVHM